MIDEDAGCPESADAYASAGTLELVQQGVQVSTKIPPGYDGRTSWFEFEDKIDDWEDVTNLDAERRGPALRNRLIGDAKVYGLLRDRAALRDADTGYGR